MTDPTDEIWRRAEPDSPCKKICVMHPTARICIGCFRTIDEIAQWGRLDSNARRAILAELAGRETQLPKKRVGRAKRLNNKA